MEDKNGKIDKQITRKTDRDSQTAKEIFSDVVPDNTINERKSQLSEYESL